jgi:two-component system, OmpR family, catabolic regulation response regulator CreB
MKYQVLIIEDEAAIADTLIYALETEGFQVTWFPLAQAAENHLQTQPVDFIILDVGLPDQNGFELCKAIRHSNQDYAETPILFLTARKEEMDRIIGLEIGGDDYVTKPFSPREISARVKAILKRTKAAPKQSTEFPTEIPTDSNATHTKAYSATAVTQGHFVIDAEKARVRYCNQSLQLTRYEYLILQTLITQPERIFSRAQLMDKVWDEPESSFERAVDTHIKSLRAKLRDAATNEAQQNPIQTHRGMGYSIHINL